MARVRLTNICYDLMLLIYFTYSENRYLLFLTENYAALDILRHYLKDILSSSSSEVPSAEDTEPFVLFGSSFPRDKEYTQVGKGVVCEITASHVSFLCFCC